MLARRETPPVRAAVCPSAPRGSAKPMAASLAAAWSDRVAVLTGGSVRALGSPSEVLTAELVSEVYEHPCDVIHHGGNLIVVPLRSARLKEDASCVAPN